MQPLEFAVAVLACYRLAQLVPLDDGPLFVFKRLRDWARARQATVWQRSLSEFVQCPYCQGVWYAGALALWIHPGGIADWLVMTLAVAGGQAFLETLGNRINDDG